MTICNCNKSLREIAIESRSSLTEVMAQQSVEIQIISYNNETKLYSATIHDKHYDLRVLMEEEDMRQAYDDGLLLNPQDL